MKKELRYHFSGKEVRYYLGGELSEITATVPKERCILITDETIHRYHPEKFNGYKTIIIPAGEQFKNQETVNSIIAELINYEANRKSLLIGIGGGVVTDITGYVASIYMRGIRFGFIPTTILSQVDASIGGKNGIDVGMYKNLVGVIRQPEFILFDFSFLKSLPDEQWVNGFAEIIKHACIRDKALFELLEAHELNDFKNDSKLLAALIEKNITIKSVIVSNDEFEEGERKLLNFGHTLGHAIENVFQLPHGFAVSIGMVAATEISVEKKLLPASEKERIVSLLKQYFLPVAISVTEQREAVIMNLKMDKKRSSSDIDFILLKHIGEALIKPIPFTEINELINSKFGKPALTKLDS
jgi:3-dehydroquinate synthase